MWYLAFESQRDTAADRGGAISVRSLRSVADTGVRGCKADGTRRLSSDFDRRRAVLTRAAAATPPLLVAASATSVAHDSEERPDDSGTSTMLRRSCTWLLNVGRADLGRASLSGASESVSVVYPSELPDCGDANEGIATSLIIITGANCARLSMDADGIGEREPYMFMNELRCPCAPRCSEGAAVFSGTALSMPLSIGEGIDAKVG